MTYNSPANENGTPVIHSFSISELDVSNASVKGANFFLKICYLSQVKHICLGKSILVKCYNLFPWKILHKISPQQQSEIKNQIKGNIFE